jgi:hypothetical protein
MDVEARNLTASISADRKNLDDALYNYRSWCNSTNRSSDIELSSIESRLILYLTYRVETSVHKNGDGEIVCMTWPELKGCTMDMRSVVYDNLANARHDRKTAKMTVIDWALKIHLFDLITYYPVLHRGDVSYRPFGRGGQSRLGEGRSRRIHRPYALAKAGSSSRRLDERTFQPP